MSRLDDELRIAFKRQEPSADFAARVLARIAEAKEPQPAPTFWQRLRDFFSPTVMRWAVATAALLLIAAVAFVLVQNRSSNIESAIASSVDNQQTFVSSEALAGVNKSNEGIKPTPKPEVSQPITNRGSQVVAKHRPQRRLHHEPVQSPMPNVEIAHDNHHKSQGEIAKEQLYKALAITSELLHEAKDIALTGGR